MSLATRCIDDSHGSRWCQSQSSARCVAFGCTNRPSRFCAAGQNDGEFHSPRLRIYRCSVALSVWGQPGSGRMPMHTSEPRQQCLLDRSLLAAIAQADQRARYGELQLLARITAMWLRLVVSGLGFGRTVWFWMLQHRSPRRTGESGSPSTGNIDDVRLHL